MKKILSIMCMAGIMLTSCSEWLDVIPEDSVIEQDLFKEATGFQNALNGVYESMASTALYGTEMSFGLVDVLGQVYALQGLNGEWYCGIQKYHYYYQAGQFQYDANEDVKAAFENIWEQGYRTIANSNNIIKNIENLPAEKFRYGEAERNMILGEALAARAVMHFDLLRLFAPAPQADDNKLYIPYVTNYPYYGGQSNLGVQAVLEKVEADLKQAKDLVMAYDTLDMAHRKLLAYRNRFSELQSVGTEEDGSTIDMLAFYFYRGYRLNAMAVEALLARVYSWWGGDKLEMAAGHAKNVVEFVVTKDSVPALRYTPNKDVNVNRKLTDDLIFCLSTPVLEETYEAAYYENDRSNTYLVLGQYDKIWKDDLADGNDYRFKLIEDAGTWGGRKPLKYVIPQNESNLKDMIPMIRMSEMHLIQAEYYASIGDFGKAADMIKEVRMGRNCAGKVNLGINNMDSFKKRLLSEVRREFFQEGQTFFYYKKYGEPLVKNMTPESFVVPKPESEMIN